MPYKSLIRKIVPYFFLFFVYTGTAQVSRFDSICWLMNDVNFYQRKEARALLDELYVIARQSPDSIRLLARCLYRETGLCSAQEIMDTSLNTKIKNHPFFGNPKYPEDHTMLSLALGMNQMTANDYAEAYVTLLPVLKEFKTEQDSFFVAKTLDLLSHICQYVGLMDEAEGYTSEAMKWVSDKQSKDYYQLRHALYQIRFARNNDVQEMMDSTYNLISDAKKILNDTILIPVYINLAANYIGNPNVLDSAYLYLCKVQSLLPGIDSHKIRAILYQNFSAYYLELGDFEKFLEHLHIARKISEENEYVRYLSMLYNGLSWVHGEMGNSDSALFYMNKYQETQEKLQIEANARKVYRKYTKTLMESFEEKETISNQKVKLRNRQIAIIVVVVIAILLLIIFYVQHQNKRKKQKLREYALQLEHERVIAHIEKGKQEELMDAKMREIVSYSMLLSNKNSLLQQVLQGHSQIETQPENTKDILKNLDSHIQNGFNIEKEWNNFKIHFEQVHPDFFARLKEHSANLTEDNLRMCAYLRIGIPTKQIAQILNIKPDSVFTHRHRLKLKFGLAENDDLDDFLKSM